MTELIIGISGASGIAYGVRLLEILHETDIRTHLIITEGAEEVIRAETDLEPGDIEALADHVYSEKDMSAPIASGSYRTAGMIIAPCSMKTLGQIASGISDNLLVRAADVCLKEERKLILMTRETPLSLIHLENMVRVKKAGASVLPASPGFYGRPQTIDDLLDIMAGRALDLAGIENDVFRRWERCRQCRMQTIQIADDADCRQYRLQTMQIADDADAFTKIFILKKILFQSLARRRQQNLSLRGNRVAWSILERLGRLDCGSNPHYPIPSTGSSENLGSFHHGVVG